jgi:hypothetical protein
MPDDVRIDDGHSTYITFANLPDIHLYEKEVTPPGVNGGGAIDTTTMRNEAWRTMSPKQLKTMSQIKATVAYATDVYPDVIAQINVNQEITIHFPNGASIDIWGWLDEFTPGNNAEGAQPTASITVIPSNHDNDGVETEPDYNAPGES